MVKKIFSGAKLVRSSAKWYIEYLEYDVESGESFRHRNKFNLHLIDDEAVRVEVAKRIIDNLDAFIRVREPKPVAKQVTTILDAIALAYKVKRSLPRTDSFSTYRTCFNLLSTWIEQNGYSNMPIEEFTRRQAFAFWDYLTSGKKYRGRTLNNYRVSLGGLWTVLIDRELATINPFDRVKPVRTEQKMRRTFTPEERRVVAAYAAENDYWVFRAILLQYYCYIRPTELSKMKFRDFNFTAGTVTIPEGNAKMWRNRVVTIPSSIMHYFVDQRFERYPANYYVFGMPDERGRLGMHPSNKPANRYRLAKRHGKMLERLKKMGKLHDIDGLQWYSWKDTGITENVRKTSPLATKDQAGHADLSMTGKYYHPEPIVEEYRQLKFELLD